MLRDAIRLRRPRYDWIPFVIGHTANVEATDSEGTVRRAAPREY